MSIEIIKPGLLTTLVGSERTGFRNRGIGPGGAMDKFAMRVANFVVGNRDDMAVMEIHLPGPEILFQQSHLISITGNGFESLVNGIPIPLWRPVHVAQNEVMSFKIKSGGRSYLAVKGGWKAENWLGSLGTHLGVQAGGYFGRALHKGDLLDPEQISIVNGDGKNFPWGISKNELDKVYFPSNEIRCLASNETNLLSVESREKFTSHNFTITPQSNRMGYRLEGLQLHLKEPVELVSSPVDAGTIQLLPDGNLIILMADHQTTGGYPRIGSVIKADLPKLAQLGPAEKITFEMISLVEAESLLIAIENQLEEIKTSCFTQINKYMAK